MSLRGEFVLSFMGVAYSDVFDEAKVRFLNKIVFWCFAYAWMIVSQECLLSQS